MKRRIKRISEQMRSLRRATAALLVIIMTLGLAQGAAFGGDYVGANIFGDELLNMDLDLINFNLEQDSIEPYMYFLSQTPNEPPPPIVIEHPASELQNLEANLDTTLFLNLETFLNTDSFQSEHISQARQNYFTLLEGNYTGNMLRQRFFELFGYHSIDDIRNNFSEIFDMPTEFVDEGLLNILTITPTYLPWAGLKHYGFDMENLAQHGFGPESDATHLSEFILQNESIFGFSALDLNGYTFEYSFNNNYMLEPELDKLEFSAGEMPLPPDYFIPPFTYGFSYEFPEQLSESEINLIDQMLSQIDHPYLPVVEFIEPLIELFENAQQDNILDDILLEGIQHESKFSEPELFNENIIAASAAEVNITLVSRTNTSVTLDLFFNSRHNVINNRLTVLDFTVPNPPYNSAWVNLLGQGLNRPLAQSGRVTISSLTPGATYIFRASVWDSGRSMWVHSDLTVTLSGARTPSLTISNITQNSFTINAVFPVEGEYGNRLRWSNGVEWTDVPGTGTNRNLRSGSFPVTNLPLGQTYRINLNYFNRQNGVPGNTIQQIVTTPLPPESHVRSHTTNLTFAFEQMDINRFNGSNYIVWQNRMQTAFNNLSSLSGWGSQFAGRTEIQTTRYKIPNFWGQSGNPILINRTFVPEMIRHINERGDWTFGTMHELSHNFDSWRWTFDAEFFANFKMAYVIDRNNATVFAGYTGFYTGLAQLRQYYRTDANPAGGGLSHTKAMALGVYHHDALTYTFLRIQQLIGWGPFRQTFQYFHNLPATQVPSSNLGKLNLFLAKLSDFSGQNVFGMFTPRELQIYEAHFGGRIGRQGATITWHIHGGNNPIQPWHNVALNGVLGVISQLFGFAFNQLPNPGTRAGGYQFAGWFRTVQPSGASAWGEFAHGQYIAPFSLGDIIDASTVITGDMDAHAWWVRLDITSPATEGQSVPRGNTNVTWSLTPDVFSGIAYNVELWDNTTNERIFNRQITETNDTIPGNILVVGRQYTIIVSTTLGRRIESTRRFVVGAPGDPFFAFYGDLGWQFPLPTSRYISSGYKLPARRDHGGIDLIREGGAIRGEHVYAAHSGTVLIAGWSNSAGNWVVIQSDVEDPITRHDIISRYMHFLHRPSVSTGRIVQGTRIGYVGNSGQSDGYHLHLDFNNGGFTNGGWQDPPHNTIHFNHQTINPQRFFPDIIFRGATSSVMP